MDRLTAGLERNRAYGLTLLRVVTGLILFFAGYGKVFKLGFSGLITQFDKMGFILPQVVGPFIGLLELIGGAALVLGVWSRYLGVIFAIQFVVATYAKLVMWNKDLASARIDILLVVVCLVIATSGAGALNLGDLLKRGN